MCPIPNPPWFRNPRSKYRMVVKVQVDFVFSRERRVEKEFQLDTYAFKGQDHIYPTDIYLFFFTSCSTYLCLSECVTFSAEIMVRNPSYHPRTCATLPGLRPWWGASLSKSSRTMLLLLWSSSSCSQVTERGQKNYLMKVWQDCWQPPYGQAIKFIPVVTFETVWNS